MQNLIDFITREDFVEPEEIREEYPKATEEQIQFILALLAVRNSLQPWESFHIFEKVARALNMEVVGFDRIEGVHPEQIWYAVKLMRAVWPKAAFSQEVLEYIKAMSNDYGFYIYPPELGYSEDDKLEKQVKDKALSGPFPLGDSFLERQAAQYLAVNAYVNEMIKQKYEWL